MNLQLHGNSRFIYRLNTTPDSCWFCKARFSNCSLPKPVRSERLSHKAVALQMLPVTQWRWAGAGETSPRASEVKCRLWKEPAEKEHPGYEG